MKTKMLMVQIALCLAIEPSVWAASTSQADAKIERDYTALSAQTAQINGEKTVSANELTQQLLNVNVYGYSLYVDLLSHNEKSCSVASTALQTLGESADAARVAYLAALARNPNGNYSRLYLQEMKAMALWSDAIKISLDCTSMATVGRDFQKSTVVAGGGTSLGFRSSSMAVGSQAPLP